MGAADPKPYHTALESLKSSWIELSPTSDIQIVTLRWGDYCLWVCSFSYFTYILCVMQITHAHIKHPQMRCWFLGVLFHSNSCHNEVVNATVSGLVVTFRSKWTRVNWCYADINIIMGPMIHKQLCFLPLKKICQTTRDTCCRHALTACCGQTPLETGTSLADTSCSSVSALLFYLSCANTSFNSVFFFCQQGREK